MTRPDMPVPLAARPEPIDLVNGQADATRPDWIRRLPVTGSTGGPVRISADLRTEGVTGTPGMAAVVFFNLEYTTGPVFWDMFLYPDTGTTPWRTYACEARARGPLQTVEMHVRFHARGRLQVRNLTIESIPPWPNDAEAGIAVFGDSTDMTCYLPHAHRLTRRLELLLRDRFTDRRIDVDNLAEGGETLKRLVESGRLERELRALPRCDIAMIRYGLNDRNLKVPAETFAPLLHDACDRILRHSPKTRIILSTTLPAAGSAVFDQQTLAVARARNLPLIRLDAFMRARSAAGDSDWHNDPGHKIGRRRDRNPPENPDGLKGDLHPNAYGAQLIAECYCQHLEPLLAAQFSADSAGPAKPVNRRFTQPRACETLAP